MNIRRTILAALVPALAVTGALAAASSAPATADTAAAPIRVAVAGDSLSEAPQSWMHQLADPGISLVGGYQHSGYDSGQVLAEIAPAEDPDVLVIMLGTNDVNHRVWAWETARNIERIAAKVRAEHVLLTYLPPSNRQPDPYTHVDRTAGNLAYSRALVALAARHGWMIADPFAPLRTPAGRYVSGTTYDGTHPTGIVDAAVAERMALYIRQADKAAAGAGW